MNCKLKNVLLQIAEPLNRSGIIWGVGASVLLNQYGLIENPTDIDITVSVDDIYTADKILSAMGKRQPEKVSDVYLTEHFDQYVIDGINVDIMAGLKIRTASGIFEYPFDELSVPHSFTINSTSIPFTTLEDWKILYSLMPGKEKKAEIIEKYFRENGIQYPSLLQRIKANTSK